MGIPWLPQPESDLAQKTQVGPKEIKAERWYEKRFAQKRRKAHEPQANPDADLRMVAKSCVIYRTQDCSLESKRNP